MPSPDPASAHYEALFHSSSLNLIIPEISSFPTSASSSSAKAKRRASNIAGSGSPDRLRSGSSVSEQAGDDEQDNEDKDKDEDEDEDNVQEADADDVASWWDSVEASPSRDVAYFDEKLFYLVSMHLSHASLRDIPGTPAVNAKEPTSEMLRFLGRLQLTMTVSFIPTLPTYQGGDHRQSLPPSASGSSLAPPQTPAQSQLQAQQQLQIPSTPRSAHSHPGSGQESNMPPVTPVPFPSMSKSEEQYANVEGVVVWEGPVEEVAGPWEEEGRNGNPASIHVRDGIGSGARAGRRVFKSERGWEVIWRGEVPIAYVRTQIQNPLLALTASMTLREPGQPRTHKRGAQSLDTMSIRSGTTIRTEGTEYDYFDDEGDDLAGLEEIDLLGGLAGNDDNMPATRLAPSLRQDLSIPSAPLASPFPLSAQTPASMPSIASVTFSSSGSGPSRERGHIPPALSQISSTTLRKSYRRVLSLAPGLRVRMRTLFLPQLLPTRSRSSLTGSEVVATPTEDEDEGERRIVLCVEVENSVEPSLLNGFEVEKVNVEVGGKGGVASTEMVCQPQTAPFPLRLGSTEQYNLLYAVSIASPTERDGSGGGLEEAVAKSLGRGDEQRPVSVTVVGRPFYRISANRDTQGTLIEESDIRTPNKTSFGYPTKPFHSRWNCTLDLAAFYASSSATTPHLPKNRNSKILSASHAQPQAQANAIAGDKRYSLAHLLSVEQEREREAAFQNQSRIGAGNGPMLPSQAINQPNGPPRSRVTSLARPPPPNSASKNDEHGLLLSVKLLSQATSLKSLESYPASQGRTKSGRDGEIPTIRPFEPFSLEVFVHNRTDRVRRFRLSIPPRDHSGAEGVENGAPSEGRVRDIWNRRRRKADEPDWGVDDASLKSALGSHLSTAPALIALENDIRCGPLIPGSSLSARIRFLALREGVHRVERLRLVGVGGGGAGGGAGGDEVDYMLSPVLDVVVGSARD